MPPRLTTDYTEFFRTTIFGEDIMRKVASSSLTSINPCKGGPCGLPKAQSQHGASEAGRLQPFVGRPCGCLAILHSDTYHCCCTSLSKRRSTIAQRKAYLVFRLLARKNTDRCLSCRDVHPFSSKACLYAACPHGLQYGLVP